MKGTNRVAAPFHSDVGTLRVNDIWYTMQGEGPDAGRNAIFLRLAGCNLRCYFCDTEFEKGVECEVEKILGTIQSIRVNFPSCNLLVITGGEPLLQNIIPLVATVNNIGVSVAIETAGTVTLPALDYYFDSHREIRGNGIICSPKTPKINEQLAKSVCAWKYIIKDGETARDGLPTVSTQIPGETSKLYRPEEKDALIYVQPMDEGDDRKNASNLRAAVNSCLHYGYRLSLQMHKIAGLP